MAYPLSYSTSNLGSMAMLGPFFQCQFQLKNLGWWSGKKIICISIIKTSCGPFYSPLLNPPSPNQILVGMYLPRLSSHEPCNIFLNGNNFLVIHNFASLFAIYVQVRLCVLDGFKNIFERTSICDICSSKALLLY